MVLQTGDCRFFSLDQSRRLLLGHAGFLPGLVAALGADRGPNPAAFPYSLGHADYDLPRSHRPDRARSRDPPAPGARGVSAAVAIDSGSRSGAAAGLDAPAAAGAGGTDCGTAIAAGVTF